MSGYPVVLNVYDMYWINQYTFPVGLGVFHSGVVVHGKEYAFGGHPNNWSGIFEMSPKSVEVLGDDFKFRETITIGTTKLLPGEVEDLLKRMGKNYQGRCYHLIDKNCNHFTSEFCQCLPREWISPEPCSPVGSPGYVSHPFKDFSGSDEDDRPNAKTKHR
ncbi:deubiquitinase DESI2-like isoform X3 [Oculina patagonica]